MFGSVNSLSLLAIPFFVTAGNIIMKSKITDKLVGFLPGGLGHVNVLTSMIFGGIQGSGCADAAAIGGMLIPAMEKQGYDTDYAVAVTAGSSMLSPIIPPSICMILYAYYTEIPVGRLFMGGLVPGIIIGTEGYLEIRKYIDVAASAEGDHIYLVNKDGEQHIPASGKCGFPFFGRMIRDCLDGTENAMKQAYVLHIMELALKAQKNAEWVEYIN